MFSLWSLMSHISIVFILLVMKIPQEYLTDLSIIRL